MDTRISGFASTRVSVGSADRAPVARNSVAVKSAAPAASFERMARSGSGVALRRTASVAPTRALTADPAQRMHDYLTGAIPPPADFAKVMGYEPVRVATKWGTRMQDPFGDVSSPGGIGPTKEFLPMAKTHDYGYDLLRYFGRTGQPLGAGARKAADALFREDMFHSANDQKGFVDRWKFRTWAQIYATAVELNSQRQGYGVP